MTKRFWTRAWAAPIGAVWGVMLDGKPMRLPSGAPLATPSAALAQAIGIEWQAAGGTVGGTFGSENVPLTGLAGAAQDCVGTGREGTLDALARYADVDLLCYRVEVPLGHAARQQAAWQPWLDWAERRYGAVLDVTTAMAHLVQPAASLEALHRALAELSDAHLAALGLAIPALGSCVLGLALAERAIDPAAAADCALLDEMYQQERWGVDAEAAERLGSIRSDIALAARFMSLTATAETVAAQEGP